MPSLTDSVKPELASSSSELIDKLVGVHDMAESLFMNKRPADAFLCSAWLAAMGACKYVDTNHPYRAGEVLKGTITIPGAKQLRIRLHPRCSTAKDTVELKVRAGSRTLGPFSGPTGPGGGGADAKPWHSSAAVVAGDTVSYELRVPATDTNPDGLWGVGLTVSADSLSDAASRQLVQKSAPTIALAVRQLATMWTPEMDSDLNALARRLSDTDGVKSTKLPMDSMCIRSHRQALAFQSIADVPTPQLRLRFALLQMFNQRLADCLACVEFNTVRRWSTGYLLHSVGHCVFLDVKMGMLDSALKSTSGSGHVSTVRLSNFDASASAARGEVDPSTSKCIFVQAFDQLGDASAAALRNTTDSDQAKVFEVKFVGEDGIDAGGVYREGLQRMVEDLFSDRFSLMVPCPNAARKSGDSNLSAYVPNPKHTDPRSLHMLEFVGQLMGISLRFKGSLPFDLASPLVWKPLVGDTLTPSDLEAVDVLYAQYLHAIRHCDRDFTLENEPHDPITSDAQFAAAFPSLTFTTNDTAGDEVELLPGGASMPVTFTNRLRFCDLVEQFRLHEFDEQVAAMKRGLATIVPIRSLTLFTASELEVLVAGRPEVDVELLKRHTKYSGGLSESDPVVKMFWEVFETLSDEERCGWIRFAWGRARLPTGGARWTSSHTLQRRGTGDASLPVAHTCFFSVELPVYTSVDRMRWGITTAIAYGGAGILSG